MADSVWRGSHPEQGNLAPDVLVALCEVLAGHSATAEDCYFCLWDGYGWIAGSSTLLHSSTVGAAGDREEAPAPAFSAEELSHPRVELPHRSYLLLAGALAAAAQIIWPPSASRRTSSGRPIGRGVPQASWTSTRPWSAARPS
jgi:hypothetical protein